MTPTVAYILKESLCVAFYNHPTIVIFISNESLYIRVYIYFIRVGAGSGGSVCCQRKEFWIYDGDILWMICIFYFIFSKSVAAVLWFGPLSKSTCIYMYNLCLTILNWLYTAKVYNTAAESKRGRGGGTLKNKRR